MRELMYETSQTLVYKVQESKNKKVAVVIGNGDIIDFRPMKMQEPLYEGCDVYTFYFQKENEGLKPAGEQLARWLKTMENMYGKIFLVMKSKCGNMVITSVANNLTNYAKYKIFVVNAPIEGTEAATPSLLRKRIYKDKIKWKKLTYKIEDFILIKIVYGNYPVDWDIQIGSNYMKENLDEELLKNFDIAVIASSLNGKQCKTVLDFILKWFDKRFKLYGDGIVSLNSQLGFKEPKKIFSANHISILKDSKKMIQKEIEKEKGRL